MMTQKIIPIFPLDLVLFPRQELPLRIFEPRYKQLVEDCMLTDGQFGVCLIDPTKTISGWNSPKLVGTIAKINKCKDIQLDGMQLQIETVGRNKFQILSIIPPSLKPPPNYDPYTIEGHQSVSELQEKTSSGEKMYIQAEVKLIPEIDENISFGTWQKLINLWKQKIITQALPEVVDAHSLDHLLEQYYLITETPTVDYVYSLSALGANSPNELQSILEANTMDDLIKKVEELMTTNKSKTK